MKNWFATLFSNVDQKARMPGAQKLAFRVNLTKRELPFTYVNRANWIMPVAQSVEITPYAEACVWFLDSVHDVARLSRLPRGWDSDDSPAVTSEASGQAIRLLMKVAHQPLPRPHVGAVPGGGLQMEWTSGDRCLELEVLPDGGVQFLQVRDEKTMVEGVLQPQDAGLVRNHVNWVTA